MSDDRPGSAANGPVARGPADSVAEPPRRSTLRAWLGRLFGHGNGSSLRASLEDMIDHNGEAGEKLDRDAGLMMLNLLEFADLRVDDVMVPRADIIAIEDSASVLDLLRQFSRANHSRLPVYRETLDDIVGMIHIKDATRWLTAKVERSAGKAKAPQGLRTRDLVVSVRQARLVRELLFVPPSMPAGDLLVKMQSTRIHMAVVVDEYGGTDGLVSIEDIVEEIVGEIADEHDEGDEQLIVAASPGVYMANARAPIDEVEQLLGIDLLPDEQDEDTDTLGGFVFSLLGRVPVRGELVRHESGVEFEIVDADPRRIRRIRIHAAGRRGQPAAP